MDEERRRTLGRRIQRARRQAGFGSQKAFALAIKIDPSSVAHAESGSSRAGTRTFDAIENGLSWPPGVIEQYLAAGDEGLLPIKGDGNATAPAAVGNGTGTVRKPDATPEDDSYDQRLDELEQLAARVIAGNDETMTLAEKLMGEIRELRHPGENRGTA